LQELFTEFVNASGLMMTYLFLYHFSGSAAFLFSPVLNCQYIYSKKMEIKIMETEKIKIKIMETEKIRKIIDFIKLDGANHAENLTVTYYAHVSYLLGIIDGLTHERQ
jgi:hypothetical protein